MDIQIKPKTVTTAQAKTLKLSLKVRDCFTATLLDANGQELHEQDDGYVPDFMPGNHYGDYVILDIDVDTGVVTNWKCDPAKLQAWVDGSDDD